ncbi:hypothetical protein ACWEOW_17885 [Monashia sp. NPDC004114]
MVRIVRVRASARRAVAALPVLALTTAGIAFAATSDAPVAGSLSVPERAITQAGRGYPEAGPAPAPMQLAPIYETYTRDWPRVDVPAAARDALRALGSLAPVRLDANGIPSLALAAYRHAADLLGTADPGCGVDWALLGAIGRVESNHARFGGNLLDAAGVAQPGIIGIALDGSRGTARITDTDHGTYDRDTAFDRAVGPMQFIPTTWTVAGRDGDGDGVENPQSLSDSVTAAGVLLCSGGAQLRDPSQAYRAVLRYNHSDEYARTVLAIADAYRRGVTVLPRSALPAARPASGSGTATPDGSGFGYAGTPGPEGTAGSGARPEPRPSDKPASRPASRPASAPSSTRPTETAPGTGRTGGGIPVPSVPGLPLPTPTAPRPTVPETPVLSAEVRRLLALPHLPLLPGDPSDLVRVLDPLKAAVVCVLDGKVVACPTRPLG